jgi:exonuclease III
MSQDHAPYVLCLIEHHLDGDEIPHLNMDNYTMGAFYRIRYFKMSGACIYVQNNLNTGNINLDNFWCDKDIEACAVSINIASLKTCILTIYRSPSSNYDIFLGKLELILQKLSENKVKVFVCGDFNVNYIENSYKKIKLDDILGSLT